MVKIDPMHYLINTILDDKEVVIFLGGGASMEGKQDKQRFPGSDDLIDRVLQKYKVKPKSKKERLDSFFSIIEQWEKQQKLALRLREFLDGEPGLAHYHLAALSIALFGESNTLLYLTKNFDDLINQTFIDLQKNQVRKFTPVVIPLHPKLPDSEFQEIAIIAEENLKRGFPVILKLFGDLNFQKPILRQADIQFEPEVEKKLKEWMAKPMIVIGYSFSDKKIKELLIASGGTSPIFMINPLIKIPPAIKDSGRIHHIKSNFSDFVKKLLEILQERSPEINRKIDKILESLDSTTLFPDFTSIQSRVKQCSKASILRAEEKIPKIEVNSESKRLIPIERKDTSPDFERFIQSDRRLLAVIGDSGSGKSTLLYRIAKSEFNKHFITLFYDVHHLQSTESLTERLCRDFRCETRQLETMFEHFDKILSAENKKLLIMIDALNESIKIDPSDLKIEIEDLGAKLPKAIKIVYSCRTVYWNSYVKASAPISSTLYHDSKEFILHFYSESESRLAFDAYKGLFKFHGDFDSLKYEFKEKIRDPLMLRMLAEGYQEERLPTFAPAVKIFKNYEESLRRKFAGTVLIDYIEELILHKLKEIDNYPYVSDQFDKKGIRTNSTLNNITMQQLGINKRDPIILLEDEGIISSLDEKKSIYRFTYDRFFEYLLGREIGAKIEIQMKEKADLFSIKNFIAILSEKIFAFQRVHFSFIQALKSEVIRRNIESPKSNWSFSDPKTLKLLLNNTDATVVNFTKDVLREFTFEADINILDILESTIGGERDWKLFALAIAGDSPKVRPILIDGLFSGDVYFVKRCIQILSTKNEVPEHRKDFENEILSELIKSNKFKKEHAIGLIYYTAIIFESADRMRHDPLEKTAKFWQKILLANRNNLEKVKEILKNEFTEIVKSEGPNFFPTGGGPYGIEYLWKIFKKDNARYVAAKKLATLLINPNAPIEPDHEEAIRFFGSEIEMWRYRNNPEKSPSFTYGVQYRIVQYILVYRSKNKFNDVKNVLDRFVETGFWSTIDFALLVMRTILQFVHYDNLEIVRSGLSSMYKWTTKFEQNTAMFYKTLRAKDPLSINYVPLEQVARIETLFLTKKNGPVPILETQLTSGDRNKVLLALLCSRYFWREHPLKILGTLEIALKIEDTLVKEWLSKIFKEIYLVHPRLMEDFFKKNNINSTWQHEIKYKTKVLLSDAVTTSGMPLYKSLFLGHSKTRTIVAELYKDLLESESINEYMGNLVELMCDRILTS